MWKRAGDGHAHYHLCTRKLTLVAIFNCIHIQPLKGFCQILALTININADSCEKQMEIQPELAKNMELSERGQN